MRVCEIHSRPRSSGIEARVAAYLAAVGPGKHVTWEELADLCWGRRLDGGPDTWRMQLAVAVCRIRKNLLPGWKIGRAYMGGVLLLRDEGRKAA
jgi:DNA-binding response OmpR family regulator